MTLEYRSATPDDASRCIELRGKTRQNAYSAADLAAIGITLETWRDAIHDQTSPGYVCLDKDLLVGMCFWDSQSGEILVVAVLPRYENMGIGKNLLQRSLADLARSGHIKSFLGCNPSPDSRSHGFYRRLGWTSTGKKDSLGDEIFEIQLIQNQATSQDKV